jgi:hypothetical protein
MDDEFAREAFRLAMIEVAARPITLKIQAAGTGDPLPAGQHAVW